MTVLERIKETAREKKNISLTVLEQELGYSNGSLAKAKDIPSSRISEISNYLNVSMDYIMTGKDYSSLIGKSKKDAELTELSEKSISFALKFENLTKENQELIMQMIDKLSN